VVDRHSDHSKAFMIWTFFSIFGRKMTPAVPARAERRTALPRSLPKSARLQNAPAAGLAEVVNLKEPFGDPGTTGIKIQFYETSGFANSTSEEGPPQR